MKRSVSFLLVGIIIATITLLSSAKMINIEHRLIRFNTLNAISLLDIGRIQDCKTSNLVLEQDLLNHKADSKGVLAKIKKGRSSIELLISSDGKPVITPNISAYGAWIYVTEPKELECIRIDIYTDQNEFLPFEKVYSNLIKGWNLLRWIDYRNPNFEKNELYKIEVSFLAAKDQTVTIGRIWAEEQPKAKILFIQDGGYKTFVDHGYPDLKKRKIPVTFAIDPVLLGTRKGTYMERMSEESVSLVSKDNNVIGFHGYKGEITSTMDTSKLRKDTINSIEWLKDRGYTKDNMWRAAYVQNLAKNARDMKDLLMASATYNGSAGVDTFPPVDPFNIPRCSIHGRSRESIDTIFKRLKRNNGLLLFYTHGISPEGEYNMRPADWEYFLSIADKGTKEGWLQFETFGGLLKEYKIPVSKGDKWVINYFSKCVEE